MNEGAGGDFSASQLGKWKMVLQCAAVVAILLSLTSAAPPTWLQWTSQALLWSAIALTIYSGINYVVLAARVMRSSKGNA
jgi:CDP-diacylglycerol--glycerol-3-phosphate 3-phosphatidyltransferase